MEKMGRNSWIQRSFPGWKLEFFGWVGKKMPGQKVTWERGALSFVGILGLDKCQLSYTKRKQ